GTSNPSNTNQYKDLIAQREFSGPEARCEEHSETRVKLVNTAS
ncbi:MAG: hypothetical protein ACI8SK_001632, partial [Shewanella sp.]